MKFLLLYSEKKTNFPRADELKNEFKCLFALDSDNIKDDLIKNPDWSISDEKILESFNSVFLKFHSDCINALWKFDESRNYSQGECKAYLLSNDIDKRVINWWNIKHGYSIRTFQCNANELSQAMDLCYAGNAIERAHQYSSAEDCREQFLDAHAHQLSQTDLSYLNSLSDRENKIKERFLKIKQGFILKARKLVNKRY